MGQKPKEGWAKMEKCEGTSVGFCEPFIKTGESLGVRCKNILWESVKGKFVKNHLETYGLKKGP